MAGGRASAPSRGAVFLTGATGFVGMELLARYLERTDRTVFVLVRAESDAHAAERLRETLFNACGTAEPYVDRVVALAGDLTRPRLGLDEHVARGVAEQVNAIVHAAASVSFELDLDQSRLVNVEGTRQVLDFAELCREHGGLRRLSYISTAYVAGTHRGRFLERDLEVGQRFRNPYEQSKYEAERLVACYRERLPITVLRPSVIVGDSQSGWTASFNVLYWPLRALARGAYPLLPARREAPVDVVSVDFVADALFELAQRPDCAGHTFHLTASEDASSIGELLELANARLGCRRPPLIPPALYRHGLHPLLLRLRPRARPFLRATEPYLSYFDMRVQFDNAAAQAELSPPAISPAPLIAYFDRLVDYALATDWGRRPLTRSEAAKRPAPARIG